MPKEIWNQGRVVGYSAYESYIRQFLSENPEASPASEKEWLSSSISSGSSLLLTIKPSENKILYIPLPSNSRLCAANTIIGNIFLGYGDESIVESDKYSFSSSVKSYGPLILNNSDAHPNGNMDEDDEYLGEESLEDRYKVMLKEYSKIIDGVIIQPGEWVTSGESEPYMDLHPNMSKSPLVKIMLESPITSSVNIILTGFIIRSVVSGTSGTDGSVPATSPEDGTFLGPSQFPWASKIVFCAPNALYSYYSKSQYYRKIPETDDEKSVEGLQIIDMKSTDPGEYYNEHFSDSRVKMKVTKFHSHDNTASAFTLYQLSSDTPPALFGSYIKYDPEKDEYSEEYLNPVDVVAPGTVKMFHTEDEMIKFESSTPNNYGFYKTQNGIIYQLLEGSNIVVPVSKVSEEDLIISGNYGIEKYYQDGLCRIQSGNNNQVVLSLSDSHGNQIKISDIPEDAVLSDTGYIYWSRLVDALRNNKKIDVLSSIRSEGTGDYVVSVDSDGNISPKSYVFSDNGAAVFKLNLIKKTDDFRGLIYGDDGNPSRQGSLFDSMKLDMFGYYSEYNDGTEDDKSTKTLNMLATMTVAHGHSSSSFGASTSKWLQTFRVNDEYNIRSICDIILHLRKTNAGKSLAVDNINSLVFTSGGRCLFTSSSDEWDGSPLIHMDVVSYVNIASLARSLLAAVGSKDVLSIDVTKSGTASIYLAGIIFGNTYSTSESTKFRSGSYVSDSAFNGSISLSEKIPNNYQGSNNGKVVIKLEFSDSTSTQLQVSL